VRSPSFRQDSDEGEGCGRRGCPGCGRRGCPGCSGCLSRVGCLLVLAAATSIFIWLLRWLRNLFKKLRGPGDQPLPGIVSEQGHPVPASIYRRPDPFIYDQYYLAKQGWADIRLEDPAEVVPPGESPTAVDSSALLPGKTYDVVARVWNNSLVAPAVHMPVHYAYLEFGIGTTKHDIPGATYVDLSVKGADACPAFARRSWTTPTTPGHYCLQIELEWPDDANPDNNLGQHNTNVKALNSPNAVFKFPVRNGGEVAQAIRLEVDAYRLPELPECEREQPREPGMRHTTDLRRHRREDYPVPEGWVVDLAPQQFPLPPGAEQEVTVHITAPDGFSGQKAFNVHGFSSGAPVGGVTLYVQG
jgi:hypothetical protein